MSNTDKVVSNGIWGKIMKTRNIFNYAAGTVLSLGLIMSWACGGSGSVSNANLSKGNNSNSIAENISSFSSSENANSTKDTSPMTVTIGEITSSSNEAKFKGRMLTVTGGKLMEIQSGDIKVEENRGDTHYVICKGDFSAYTSMSSRISELLKEGKQLKVEIKGIFVGHNLTYATLEPCVISDLEK